MPHRCTDCGRIYPDGSDDVLNGCECSNNQFEFVPASQLTESEKPVITRDEEWIEPTDTKHPSQQDTKPLQEIDDDSIIVAQENPQTENSSQTTARKTVVSEDDLPNTPSSPTDVKKPNVEELKQRLNSQFEGIKILQPGQYEVNILELYKRQESIIALQEDGRYIINVPSMMKSEYDAESK